MALFTWLNSWGCRQFAKDHHATTASASLTVWAEDWLDRLPAAGAHLTDLTADEIRLCAAAYEPLRLCVASLRRLPGGRVSEVAFGPAGAAKALFAFRPNVFAPWDDPIRNAYGWGPDGVSFSNYLSWTAQQLRALATEARKDVAELPALVGRPLSTPPKLIDEYNWVTITKGCRPPRPGELAEWAQWAGGAAHGSGDE
jgi:hypothetical protein